MRTRWMIVLMAAGAMLAAGPAAGQCTLDHFLVGQDNGTLMVDDWQVYRHWKHDYSDPYGAEYYEFIYSDVFEFWARSEPGFGAMDDGTHDLVGTRGVDYNLVVERLYASPGIEMYDDNWQELLASDGATFCLSDYTNHHVHMKYLVWAGPTQHYEVRYRLVDELDRYAPSAPFSVRFGAPEPATLALAGLGLIGLLGRRWGSRPARRRGPPYGPRGG